MMKLKLMKSAPSTIIGKEWNIIPFVIIAAFVPNIFPYSNTCGKILWGKMYPFQGNSLA